MDTGYKGTNPIAIAWLSLKALYEDLFPFVLLSLLTWACAATIVLAFPAVAALHEMARLALEGRAVDRHRWWEEARAQFGRAWKIGGGVVLISLVLVANALFYGRQESTLWRYVAVFWLWLLILWAMSAPYVWALNALQEEPRTWRIVRNAVYLALLRPFHTLMMGVLLLAVTAISVVFPLFLLVLPAYVALYATLLARQLLLDIRRRHREG